jgi:hypothetical protein
MKIIAKFNVWDATFLNQGEQYKYSLYLGNKLAEELYLKSKQIVKFADVELIDMIDYYKQKVNILHKFS